MGEKIQESLVLGLGNPLLDMTIVMKDTSWHKKYDLPIDGQLEISEDQRSLFSLVMEREDVEYTAGGCVLNTLRVFSWALGEKNRAIFVGGIGVDDVAGKLKEILESSGVITHYVIVKNKPTGSCAALVLGAQRCLCADIGAASVCRPEHVFEKSLNRLMPHLNSTPVIYIEGYFVTHSFDTALKVAQHCRETGKLFMFNLCGSYVCENHFNELGQLLPFIDILFGYIEEYKTLQKFVDVLQLCEDFYKDKDNIIHSLGKVFRCLSGEETPTKKAKTKSDLRRNGEIELNGRKNSVTESDTPNNHLSKTLSPWKAIRESKLVVVTQGPSPLLYARDTKVYEREVAPIHPSKIVDTTGAGDSFVGGFLAAAAKGEELESCLDCGVWTAQQLLQEKGCTIPKTPATFL